MSTYTMDKHILDCKETGLYQIHQSGYGYRFVPQVYYKANGKIEQIDIVDLMYRRIIKECYQVRSANTFMNKLFNKFSKLSNNNSDIMPESERMGDF